MTRAEHLAAYNRSEQGRRRSSDRARQRNTSSSPPRKGRKFTDQEIREFGVMREAGLRWKEIARIHGMTEDAIRRHWHRYARGLMSTPQRTFDRLDAYSRTRSLSDRESERMERAMRQLGMMG